MNRKLKSHFLGIELANAKSGIFGEAGDQLAVYPRFNKDAGHLPLAYRRQQVAQMQGAGGLIGSQLVSEPAAVRPKARSKYWNPS